MKLRYAVILAAGAVAGGAAIGVITTPPTAKADAKVEKIDRLEITDPAGKVTIVIHSDPVPTVEVSDDKGKVTKMDLRDLARLSRRFGDGRE